MAASTVGSYPASLPSLDYSADSASTGFSSSPSVYIEQRLLDFDDNGALVPDAGGHVVYVCDFWFLKCPFWSHDEEQWKTHCLCHFRRRSPPRRVTCPICYNFDYEYADGTDAWEARMHHMAEHFQDGETYDTNGPPDPRLCCFLWQQRLISDVDYQELITNPNSQYEHRAYTHAGNSRSERRRRRDQQ